MKSREKAQQDKQTSKSRVVMPVNLALLLITSFPFEALSDTFAEGRIFVRQYSLQKFWKPTVTIETSIIMAATIQ